MNKNKLAIPVSYLNPGDKFEFVNLSNNYKDCRVVRNSESGTYISASHKRGKNDLWKPLSIGYIISNNSQVYLID